MKRRADAKNDFFYGLVMVALFAVLILNVVGELIPGGHQALNMQFDEAVEARTLAAAGAGRSVI